MFRSWGFGLSQKQGYKTNMCFQITVFSNQTAYPGFMGVCNRILDAQLGG